MIYIRNNGKRAHFLTNWTGYHIQWWEGLKSMTIGIYRWSFTVGWKENT